ncbi:MAG: hypothetical protein AAGJ51_06005 [Pseudomonadota bacterium]
MTDTHAASLAERLLSDTVKQRRLEIGLPLAFAGIEAGDLIMLGADSETWLVTDIADGDVKRLSLDLSPSVALSFLSVEPGERPVAPPIYGQPLLAIVDAPVLPGDLGDTRPLLAVSADPWPGAVSVYAGTDATSLTRRAVIETPAGMGRLVEPLAAGPLGRWDFGNDVLVHMPGLSLSSISRTAVLSGGNAVFVQASEGWELLAFQHAVLIAEDTYQLSGLLRGLQGTDAAADSDAPSDALVVFVNDALVRAAFFEEEAGLERLWRAGQTGEGDVVTINRAGRLPWRVAHLTAQALAGGDHQLGWVRRGSDVLDSWEQPDIDTDARFAVSAFVNGAFEAAVTVTDTAAIVPAASTKARVAEIGADGRYGPWVSIAL